MNIVIVDGGFTTGMSIADTDISFCEMDFNVFHFKSGIGKYGWSCASDEGSFELDMTLTLPDDWESPSPP